MANPSRSFLALVLLTAVSAGGDARAGERLDLTEVVAPLPQLGDYKVFVADDGSWVREEVLAAQQIEGVWQIQKRHVDAEGDEDVFFEYVEPGVEIRASRGSGGSPELPAFAAELSDDARTFALSAPAGRRAARIADHWDGGPLFPGFFIITFRLRGAQRVAETGALETPYTSHADAVRIQTRTSVRSYRLILDAGFDEAFRRPTGWLDARRVSSWFVEGLGLVGETGEHRTSRHGRSKGRVAYEIWLQEGVIGGVPYP